jgi:hypothetical protein
MNQFKEKVLAGLEKIGLRFKPSTRKPEVLDKYNFSTAL